MSLGQSLKENLRTELERTRRRCIECTSFTIADHVAAAAFEYGDATPEEIADAIAELRERPLAGPPE